MQGIVVIKCGGSTMDQLPDSFFQAIAKLQQEGRQIVIVHGGGPAINGMLDRVQITPQFVDGLRVTCEDTLRVVEMVLCGSINKVLVRRLTQAGAKAWGVSGIDGQTLIAQKTAKPLGWVGEITKANTAIPQAILAQGYVPVIAPLSISEDGANTYNINADVAAGAIAAALAAEKLIMVTDVPGILRPQADGTKAVVAQTSAEEIQDMIQSEIITGGMIPKVQAALDALGQGVDQVVICRGTAEDLLGVCTGEAVGTTVRMNVNHAN
ncbi:acetylglutamate kinase [Brevibacillus agri]|uniref:Acetylglutamate kinase n=1 Tax=Brevibacillus agri TaxID=51101 RepID=A0A3M8B790_9BACL|nr:acetylglutamate kinase [Brevibacillus agri]MDT7985564.1 acetylglutamate kinase [Clostridium perfringens]MCG5250113.1 acetylglutamate kinase [Brevibacillus agri]MDN4094882.1 acetylglutamate kinase [Brevibacillus agri]MED3499123.1 acetylglutamate kinase [Brevibacillus agri]QAV12274.1 acetylglutamate kinase [Brevibacillus agri]